MGRKNMKELPVRKAIRLKGYDYSGTGYYFVTICIKDRHELLGQIVGATVPGRPFVELSELGSHVDSAITYYSTNNLVGIDKYVIMPNHIHMIIVIPKETGDRGRSPLPHIVRNLKSYVTKKAGFSPWQKSFHDHIIRNEADYMRIWQYIDDNPATWAEDTYFISQ
jgi:REP element-mobilizing transposase RayT